MIVCRVEDICELGFGKIKVCVRAYQVFVTTRWEELRSFAERKG